MPAAGRVRVGRVSIEQELPVSGRGEELARLRGALAAVRAGGFRAALISGEAGAGKSWLVAGALADARLDGIPIHHAAASELERDRPFGVLVDAFDLSAEAVDPDRVAIGRVLARARDPRRAELRHEISLRVAALAVRLCAGGPIVVVLEDLQWADAAAAVAIGQLLEALRDRPACVLMTARLLPANPALEAVLGRFAADVERVDLAPLDATAMAGIAMGHLGATPGPGLERLLAGCGGNPSYAVALAEGLAQEGGLVRVGVRVDTRATLPPAALRRRLLERLAWLDDECRDMLTLAALLGPRFTIEQVVAAMGRDVRELLPVLRRAFDAGLLGDGEGRLHFRHDAVRQTLVEQLTPALREALERSVAAAVRALEEPASGVDHSMPDADSLEGVSGRRVPGAVQPLPTIVELSATAVRRSALRVHRVHPSRAAETAPLDGSPPGWDTLTRTEREVVQLAARGLTNRQVGERLFISPRTVETHLSHVFAKLDVRSRVELAHVVGRLVDGRGRDGHGAGQQAPAARERSDIA